MPDPVATHIGGAAWTVTPNLLAVPLGPASPSRVIVLAIGLRRSATPGRAITSVTLDGVAATILGQIGTGNTNLTACLAAIAWPSGIAADVNIIANGSYVEGCLEVYAVTDIAVSAFDMVANSVDGGDTAVALDVPDGGCAIACVSLTAPSTDPVTWSGLTPGSDEVNGAQFRFATAYENGLTAGPAIPISVNNAAIREALIAASWGVGSIPPPLPARTLNGAQTLSAPVQILTLQHPRNITASQSLPVPYQTTTMINFPPRKAREAPPALPFNTIPMPDGTQVGSDVAVRALKDLSEQLIGTRGDGSKKAVLHEDLLKDDFINQYAFPRGAIILLPTTTQLPETWIDTALASPVAGYRWIKKL